MYDDVPPRASKFVLMSPVAVNVTQCPTGCPSEGKGCRLEVPSMLTLHDVLSSREMWCSVLELHYWENMMRCSSNAWSKLYDFVERLIMKQSCWFLWPFLSSGPTSYWEREDQRGALSRRPKTAFSLLQPTTTDQAIKTQEEIMDSSTQQNPTLHYDMAAHCFT